jgi:regulatory protein
VPPEAALRQDVMRFLRVRERTRREVADYLRRRGHAPELISRALDELVEVGLVDDARFARVYLRDRQRLHPLGRAAVKRELQARGVDPEAIEAALAESDPPWDEGELARAAVERRWARWPVAARRERAVRFLRTRGFNAGSIRGVIERLERETGGEDRDGDDLE